MASSSNNTSDLITTLERVDELCLRFENDWLAGRRPRVEDYLAGLPEESSHQFLTELLLLEWDYRFRAGETVDREEYTKRFSTRQEAVEQAWQRSKGCDRGGAATVATSVAPSADSIDRKIVLELPGHAQITRIGNGGMGEVYKAWDTRLKRWVALKQVRLQQATPAHLARFRREAEALARLAHPRIVTVYGFVEHDGQPVLVMEYVAGGSLEERLGKQALPPAEAARLVALLAWGVQAAHEAGVVHRDLKPANVLMDHPKAGDPGNVLGGHPKISDFGLAALSVEASPSGASLADHPKLGDLGPTALFKPGGASAGHGPTLEGTVIGTPAYMSPEQADGRRSEVGPATDVWALGVILYRCLTGRLPFAGDSVLDTIERIKTMQIQPLRDRCAEVPAELEAICMACLQKAPENRPTAARLAERLEANLRGESVVIAPGDRCLGVPQTLVSERGRQSPAPGDTNSYPEPVGGPAPPRRRWLLTARRRWLFSARGGAAALASLLPELLTSRIFWLFSAASVTLAAVLFLAIPVVRLPMHRDTSAPAAAPMSMLEVLALSEDLKSDDPETRAKAAVALGKAGKDARVAMPALLDALRDTDEKVRDLVADALDRAGPFATVDLPALSAALRDDDPDIRTYAVSALEELGEASWEEIDRVRELTKDPDPYGRAAAEKTLARMEKDMLESLRNRLKDSNPATRKEAAERLSELGGASDDAADKAAASLMAAMTDDNEAVRVAVSKALSDFGAQVVPMLSEALRNQNVVARRMAIKSLSEMGDNAIDAAPVLAGMVDDPDVGAAAGDALYALGDLAVPVIAAALGSPTIVDNRRVVLQNLLVRIGPGGLPAINYYVNRYPRARVYFNPVFNQLNVRNNMYVRAPLTDPYALGYYRDFVGRFRVLEHADRQFLDLEKARRKLNMNEAAFKAFLRRVDRNGDGQVSRAEYERWAHDHANLLAKEDHARKAVQDAEKNLHRQVTKSTAEAQNQASALVRYTLSVATKENLEQRAAAEAKLRAMRKKAQPLQAQAHRELLNKQRALAQVQRHAPAAKHAPAPTKRMQPSRPPVNMEVVERKPPTRKPVVYRPPPQRPERPAHGGGGRRR